MEFIITPIGNIRDFFCTTVYSATFIRQNRNIYQNLLRRDKPEMVDMPERVAGLLIHENKPIRAKPLFEFGI